MNRTGDNLTCTGSNEGVVRALARNDVEFVLVGGLAVAWHCANRLADDMDLLVNPTPENSERIFLALSSLRLDGFMKGSFTRFGLQAPLKQVHYADLLTPSKSGPSFAEVAADAVAGKLFNIPVRVASVHSLIRAGLCGYLSASSSFCHFFSFLKGI